MKIKAIETLSRGRYFRSRLEARWAVAFDALSIKWDYEIVGYSIGTIRYLPDFYLPEIDLHVEIKPSVISVAEQVRLDQIKNQWTERAFAIIKGEPALGQYEFWLSAGSENLLGPYVFAECRRCAGISYRGENEWGNLGPHTCDTDREPLPDSDKMLAAYKKVMRSFRGKA